METRVAVIGIIIENQDSVQKLNAILHEYRDYIIGRMKDSPEEFSGTIFRIW